MKLDDFKRQLHMVWRHVKREKWWILATLACAAVAAGGWPDIW